LLSYTTLFRSKSKKDIFSKLLIKNFFLCIPKLVKTLEHFALMIHSSIYAVIEIEGIRLLPGMFFSVVFSYFRLLLQFFISELKVCIPINMNMMIFLFECSRIERFIC